MACYPLLVAGHSSFCLFWLNPDCVLGTFALSCLPLQQGQNRHLLNQFSLESFRTSQRNPTFRYIFLIVFFISQEEARVTSFGRVEINLMSLQGIMLKEGEYMLN